MIEVMLLVRARLDEAEDAVLCLEPDHQLQGLFTPVFALAGVYSPLPGKALLPALVLTGVALAVLVDALVVAVSGKRSGSRQSCSPMTKPSASLVGTAVGTADFVLMGFWSFSQSLTSTHSRSPLLGSRRLPALGDLLLKP